MWDRSIYVQEMTEYICRNGMQTVRWSVAVCCWWLKPWWRNNSSMLKLNTHSHTLYFCLYSHTHTHSHTRLGKIHKTKYVVWQHDISNLRIQTAVFFLKFQLMFYFINVLQEFGHEKLECDEEETYRAEFRRRGKKPKQTWDWDLKGRLVSKRLTCCTWLFDDRAQTIIAQHVLLMKSDLNGISVVE